jgi:hypothetical protein
MAKQHERMSRLLWHADKLFFGMVLLVCALAVFSFWTSGSTPAGEPGPVANGEFNLIRIPFADPGNSQLPDLAIDIATDPDEYSPRPGEHVCVSPACTYIVPETLRYCPKCHADQHDRDRDRMTDEWEMRYRATDPDVADAEVDYDNDKFTNVEEFNGGSDPDDPKSIPGPIRLVEINQRFVDALFRGFATRRDGTTAIQLNWGDDTHTEILDLGDEFRGYTLERIDKQVVKEWLIDKFFDKTVRTLVLRRPDGGELRLPRHTKVREPERFGVFISSKAAGERAQAYAGQTVQIDGHSYVVNEVSPNGARLTGDRGEQYNLELRPEMTKVAAHGG